MSQPTTLRFSQMLILVGNGGSPETFAEPCGLTARNFDIGGDVTAENFIGSDWNEAEVGALSCKLSGSGVLAVESYSVWSTWALSRKPVNTKIQMAGAGTYQGAFVLSQLSVKATSGNRVSIDVAMASSGAVVHTP